MDDHSPVNVSGIFNFEYETGETGCYVVGLYVFGTLFLGLGVSAYLLDSAIWGIMAVISLIFLAAALYNWSIARRGRALYLDGIRYASGQLDTGKFRCNIGQTTHIERVMKKRRGRIPPAMPIRSTRCEMNDSKIVLVVRQREGDYFRIERLQYENRIHFWESVVSMHPINCGMCTVLDGELVMLPQDSGDSYNKSLVKQLRLLGQFLKASGMRNEVQCKLHFQPSGSQKHANTLLYGLAGYVISEVIDGFGSSRMKSEAGSGVIISRDFTHHLVEMTEEYGWEIEVG